MGKPLKFKWDVEPEELVKLIGEQKTELFKVLEEKIANLSFELSMVQHKRQQALLSRAYIENHRVQYCPHCQGAGWIHRLEQPGMPDFFMYEYYTDLVIEACKVCEGAGLVFIDRTEGSD